MQFPAAIGLSSKRAALRDEIDAVLGDLAPRIQELGAKYWVATGPAITFTDAGPIRIAAAEPAGVPVQAEAGKADAAKARNSSTAPVPTATVRMPWSKTARST
jgi:hypothetical protein